MKYCYHNIKVKTFRINKLKKDRRFIAQSARRDEIPCILGSQTVVNLGVNELIELFTLLNVDAFLIVIVNILEYFRQAALLLLIQRLEGLMFCNERVDKHFYLNLILARLLILEVLHVRVHSVHYHKEDQLFVLLLACIMQRVVPLLVYYVKIDIVLLQNSKHFYVVVDGRH